VGPITNAIESLPPAAAYAIIFALVFGEAAVFLGFVLPGETAVVLGGFLASTGHLEIVLLCALVFVAAVLGDSVGYEVGKKFGPRVVALKILQRHRSRLDKAQTMLRERGGPAVFMGRFTAFFRAVMPGLAGLSQMHYRLFLPWNALGGLAWGVGFCLLGYFAGNSYERVASQVGEGAAIAVGLVVVVALIGWHVRRKRAEKHDEERWEREHPEVSDPS
jgi:membrane protein DedA with SNARE-associated domain